MTETILSVDVGASGRIYRRRTLRIYDEIHLPSVQRSGFEPEFSADGPHPEQHQRVVTALLVLAGIGAIAGALL